MYIKNLRLENYRNIKSAEITFSQGINIMYGENANGKTNVIEAVFMFAGGRSFRTKNAADTIAEGTYRSSAALVYSDAGDRSHRMDIESDRNKLRKYTFNGVLLRKISEFIGSFRAVLFTPDHLSLVKGTPDIRRKFADMAISQIKPVYISCLSEYTKILGNRNKLLKELRSGRLNLKDTETELDVWTEHMVKYAAFLTKYRDEYISRLSDTAPKFYSGLSGGKEEFTAEYSTCLEKIGVKISERKYSAVEIEKLYASLYDKGRKDELRFGSTLYGPHRDDIYISIDNKSARGFASQGQQRSAVLAIKLAEGEISRSVSGEYPVFLLDDILSELDRGRQNYLLKNLVGRQVIITCCGRDLFAGFDLDKDKSAVFEVVNGSVTKNTLIP